MITGDTDEWRDLGFVRWHDPLASLENPKGSEFKQAIREENRRWNKAHPHTTDWAAAFKQFYDTAMPCIPSYAHETAIWPHENITIKIQHRPGHKQQVWLMSTTDAGIIKEFSDLSNFGYDPESELFYTIQDVGKGAELLELQIHTISKILWKSKPVGPFAAFQGKTILFQGVENALRYPTVLQRNARSGESEHVIYKNTDMRVQVELYKPANQRDTFVKTANALNQRIGRIVGNSVIWITHNKNTDGNGETLIPISADVYASNGAIYYKSRKIPLPTGEYVVDVMLSQSVYVLYVVTTSAAKESLYALDLPEGHWTAIRKGTRPNEIQLCKDSTNSEYILKQPETSIELWDIQKNRRITKFPEPLRLTISHNGTAKSDDGTAVPYTYISTRKNPRGLIVEGYGAYGISCHRSYPIHWLPWISKGYALAVAAPRGGSEDGDKWYDGARTATRKHKTFEDTAAVIQAVQRRFGISTQKTIFYGRSAGGWLAAAIGLFYPGLTRAIYAEVPYLDVLRTTTNHKLPLTQLEYDEFGNPASRPVEFYALAEISPVDAVYIVPPKAPVILLKTAINDVQVLPYEALKFAKKLRAAGWTVFVAIDSDGGHFAAKGALESQQAADAAFLDSLLNPRSHSRPRTRKRRVQSSIGTRRRSRSF